MSYDVFFQGFAGGDAAAGRGTDVQAMLDPYVVLADPEHSFVRIAVEDGGADVHLSDDHMMVNHAGGTATWDLLVRAAITANWTILIPGGPPAITDESQRAQLPVELTEDAVLVTTGGDLLTLIESL